MLFGIHGPAGSGKDTAGAYLIERYGFKRLSFATPIYDVLEKLGFGRPTTQAEKDALIDDLGVSWRHAAQTLGTEWGRQMIHPELWVILAGRGVRQNPDDKLVLTDVRFENETAMVRESGGVMIHLKGRKAETTVNPTHESEKPLEIMAGDIIIHNDVMGLDALHLKLDIGLRRWL